MNINNNLEVIAVDVKTQKKLLIAIKKEQYAGEDLCLQIVIKNANAMINNKLYSISSTGEFKEYRFIDADQKEIWTARCFKYLTDAQIRRINFLFNNATSDTIPNQKRQ